MCQLKDSWDAIRVLDEEENWAERNRVLSRSDHEQLVKCAKVCTPNVVRLLCAWVGCGKQC